MRQYRISNFFSKTKSVLDWIPLLVFIADLVVFGWKPQTGPLRFLFHPRLDSNSCKNEKVNGNDGRLYIYKHRFKILKPYINLNSVMRLNFYVESGKFQRFLILEPENIPKSAINPISISEEKSTEGVTVFMNFVEDKFLFEAKIITDRRLSESECIINF